MIFDSSVRLGVLNESSQAGYRVAKDERKTRTDKIYKGAQLMPDIKRRDKRRNNSVTFNKRHRGIGRPVGFNQVPGSPHLSSGPLAVRSCVLASS